MDLNLLAEQMKTVARQNPHNQEREPICPEICHREIEVDGIPINVVLTYNVWDSMPIEAWQLSVSRVDYKGLPSDDITKKVVEALLGTRDVVELTSMMPPIARPDIIRQFTCQIC